jgi:hypothetical protein
LSCASDLAIPGFWSNQNQSPSQDTLLSICSREPSWISAFRSRPAHVQQSSSSGIPDSGCTVTAFGSNELFELAYEDGARFFVDKAGARIWACTSDPLTTDYLATYLRGPVMGFVLRLRGVPALHSSAISIRGRAVVLCGSAGAGKSTTAAALALRGIPVLSDDITALGENENGYVVEPGCPWICLWPEAVASLLGDPAALPRMTKNWEKRYLALDEGTFESTRQPLGAIYLLAPRSSELSAPCVADVNSREAVLELVKNTYMNWVLNRTQRAAEFDVLSRLVNHIPVRRLVAHTDPARIGALCDLLLADSECVMSCNPVGSEK